MPPSLFAAKLSEQLRKFFRIEDGEELAAVIDFNAKFIEQHRDDLASLLFIEFGEFHEPTITLDMAKAIVARVQKRIYRTTRKREQSLEGEVEAKRSITPTDVDRVIEDFVATLPTEEIVLFQLRFVDGRSINEICQKFGLKKSNAYERLAVLRERFERFVREAN